MSQTHELFNFYPVALIYSFVNHVSFLKNVRIIYQICLSITIYSLVQMTENQSFIILIPYVIPSQQHRLF